MRLRYTDGLPKLKGYERVTYNEKNNTLRLKMNDGKWVPFLKAYREAFDGTKVRIKKTSASMITVSRFKAKTAAERNQVSRAKAKEDIEEMLMWYNGFVRHSVREQLEQGAFDRAIERNAYAMFASKEDTRAAKRAFFEQVSSERRSELGIEVTVDEFCEKRLSSTVMKIAAFKIYAEVEFGGPEALLEWIYKVERKAAREFKRIAKWHASPEGKAHLEAVWGRLRKELNDPDRIEAAERQEKKERREHYRKRGV